MKRLLLTLSMCALAAPALALDVNVNVNLGQPGYYGTLDPSGYGTPRLIYPDVRIAQPLHGAPGAPMYLRVPPGHAKHWGKNCHKYNACHRPVYFVDDRWYNEVYAPRAREQRGLPAQVQGHALAPRRDDRAPYFGNRDDDRGDRGRARGNKHRDNDNSQGNGRGRGGEGRGDKDRGHGKGKHRD